MASLPPCLPDSILAFWSIVTAFTALVGSFGAIFATRALLDLGEGSYFHTREPMYLISQHLHVMSVESRNHHHSEKAMRPTKGAIIISTIAWQTACHW